MVLALAVTVLVRMVLAPRILAPAKPARPVVAAGSLTILACVGAGMGVILAMLRGLGVLGAP